MKKMSSNKDSLEENENVKADIVDEQLQCFLEAEELLEELRITMQSFSLFEFQVLIFC